MTSPWFAFVEGWAADLRASAPSDLTIAFAAQLERRPKAAASVTLEGPVVAGQLTVWDTGETEVEAYAIASGECVLTKSRVIGDETTLASSLAELLTACERAKPE